MTAQIHITLFHRNRSVYSNQTTQLTTNLTDSLLHNHRISPFKSWSKRFSTNLCASRWNERNERPQTRQREVAKQHTFPSYWTTWLHILGQQVTNTVMRHSNFLLTSQWHRWLETMAGFSVCEEVSTTSGSCSPHQEFLSCSDLNSKNPCTQGKFSLCVVLVLDCKDVFNDTLIVVLNGSVCMFSSWRITSS